VYASSWSACVTVASSGAYGPCVGVADGASVVGARVVGVAAGAALVGASVAGAAVGASVGNNDDSDTKGASVGATHRARVVQHHLHVAVVVRVRDEQSAAERGGGHEHASQPQQWHAPPWYTVTGPVRSVSAPVAVSAANTCTPTHEMGAPLPPCSVHAKAKNAEEDLPYLVACSVQCRG